MNRVLNKKILGLLISVILILVIINQLDINETLLSFKLINPIYIVPVIPIYLLSFVIRAIRWKIILLNKDLKLDSLLSSIFIGFSLNCILPARAGEIYRAYIFSKKEELNKAKVFTSVVLERILDGVILFIILFTSIYLTHSNALFSSIALSTGSIFIGGFIVLLCLVKVKEKRKNKSSHIVSAIFDGLGSLNSNSLLIKVSFLSLLVWLMEGSITFLVIKSFGIDISYIGALLVLTITAFASLIPAGPAAIGPYQWGYIIALSTFQVTPELSLAVSVINQLVLMLIVLTAGILYTWKDHINLESVQELSKNDIN